MPMVKLYAYLLEKKLVTLIFAKPKGGPPLLNFDSSKKCEHHFKVEGHTLEVYIAEASNPRPYRQQVSTIRQHSQAERHHQYLASSSRRECECYLYSEGEDLRFLISLIPLESHVAGLSPRKSYYSG